MTNQQHTHIGGHPLIDFINTEMTPNGRKVDLLVTNEDVIFWLTDIGFFPREAVQFNWQEEKTLLHQVHTFRQKMRTMIVSIADEKPIPSNVIKIINEALTEWQGQPRLGQDEGRFVRELDFSIENSGQLVALIADTAVDLLTTANLNYVKKCGNDECTRYFLDTSKNHSRRWCSMEGCGNRMKARAHYARQK